MSEKVTYKCDTCKRDTDGELQRLNIRLFSFVLDSHGALKFSLYLTKSSSHMCETCMDNISKFLIKWREDTDV